MIFLEKTFLFAMFAQPSNSVFKMYFWLCIDRNWGLTEATN